MRKSIYTEELLIDAVKTSTTWSEVCRKIGVKPATGSQTYIRKRAILLDLDTTHFLGKSWSRGKTFSKRPIEDYLKIDGKFIGSDALKKRLINEGLKDSKCENCKLSSWLKIPIPIELHHINGDRNDNRLENLQILCRNCHGITENYAGRKLKRSGEKANALFLENRY